MFYNFVLSILLYLGPDTIMPLASVCGGLVGFVLIFWRYLLGFGRKAYRIITRTEEPQLEDVNVDVDADSDVQRPQ